MDNEPAWQRDFPVERQGENAVSRRQFLRFLALSSLAFFLGSLAVALRRAFSPTGEAAPRLLIAQLAQVPPGQSLSFSYPDHQSPAILVHLPTGELVAYDQRCTHLRCPVYYETRTGRLECPCHEGAFDPRTGTRLSGPPPLPLRRIRLEVSGQDVYAVGRG